MIKSIRATFCCDGCGASFTLRAERPQDIDAIDDYGPEDVNDLFELCEEQSCQDGAHLCAKCTDILWQEVEGDSLTTKELLRILRKHGVRQVCLRVCALPKPVAHLGHRWDWGGPDRHYPFGWCAWYADDRKELLAFGLTTSEALSNLRRGRVAKTFDMHSGRSAGLVTVIVNDDPHRSIQGEPT